MRTKAGMAEKAFRIISSIQNDFYQKKKEMGTR
jgi:hypothetical protein